MGRFKPLMDYNDKTFLQNIITNLSTICEQIIVVTGFNSEELKKETLKTVNEEDGSISKKLLFVKNENFEKGMFTSLQKGISRTKKTDWVLYHFVDQPGLPVEFYTDFVGQIDNAHNWIQPSYDNHSGHPVLLRKDLFDPILQADENSNLRELNKMPVVKRKKWECYYKKVLQDIDTPEDYQRSIDPFF
jgi:molybdenum cofactor cytidylyltransferase